MTLSLERGFRRITWVVSIGILAVSSIIVCLIWHSEKQTWEEAGKPFQSPSPTVYVSVSNVAFQFVEGFEPRLIKEELDRFMGVRSHVAYKPVAKDAGIKIEDLNIALPNGLSLIMRGSNRDVISHVYLPATNTTSSALYSRKEILQKESMNLLTGAESEIL
ncbi:MAG TPA: hypothetical protein VEQ38_23670 [Verrucomicrobiae bacterium]|nr:hypothetical protein [Verrucomicrobiae bacterium]